MASSEHLKEDYDPQKGGVVLWFDLNGQVAAHRVGVHAKVLDAERVIEVERMVMQQREPLKEEEKARN